MEGRGAGRSIDTGDQVVVLQREYRRGRGSGVELVYNTAAVFEVRDGRVVRIQGYMDQAKALEAVELSEQDIALTRQTDERRLVADDGR